MDEKRLIETLRHHYNQANWKVVNCEESYLELATRQRGTISNLIVDLYGSLEALGLKPYQRRQHKNRIERSLEPLPAAPLAPEELVRNDVARAIREARAGN